MIGTQFEKAMQSVESSVTAILSSADEFADALKATAIKAGGSLSSELPEHQKAFEIFGKMTFAYYTVWKTTRSTSTIRSSGASWTRT